jgi:hypothetical protein
MPLKTQHPLPIGTALSRSTSPAAPPACPSTKAAGLNLTVSHVAVIAHQPPAVGLAVDDRLAEVDHHSTGPAWYFV